MRRWLSTRQQILSTVASRLESARTFEGGQFESVCFNFVIADRAGKALKPVVDATPDRRKCVNIDITVTWADIAELEGHALWDYVKPMVNLSLAELSLKYKTRQVDL